MTVTLIEIESPDLPSSGGALPVADWGSHGAAVAAIDVKRRHRISLAVRRGANRDVPPASK
jgi:hypothetical protein